MGILLTTVEVVGGCLAGSGANILTQNLVMELGLRYGMRNSKLMSAAVACTSWTLGCAADIYTRDQFVKNVEEFNSSVESLKKLISEAKEDMKKDDISDSLFENLEEEEDEADGE